MKPAGAILRSWITCPHCHVAREETMPTDACTYLLRVHRLPDRVPAEARRLLRVLFVRHDPLSARAAVRGVLFGWPHGRRMTREATGHGAGGVDIPGVRSAP